METSFQNCIFNSGNSKVSNLLYTTTLYFTNIVHIYFYQKPILTDDQKRSYFFLLSLKGNRTPEEFAQSIPYVEVAQTEALGNCGD